MKQESSIENNSSNPAETVSPSIKNPLDKSADAFSDPNYPYDKKMTRREYESQKRL